jgi:3-phosphoglycerate kinase
MKTLRDIKNLEGVKVLVRADFNVPLRNGVVADNYRIKMAFPTLDFLMSKGAKVIVVSHIEANKSAGAGIAANTLKPIALEFERLGRKLLFVENFKKAYETAERILKNGECMMLENIRSLPGEEANDSTFAQELASLADIYVNEAFPVSHRSHASIVGVSRYLPSYAGLQFEQEVKYLSRAFNPAHPFVFILGGAKFGTKLPLIERFMEIADHVFIGGALANDLLKEKGFEIGASMVSDGVSDFKQIISSPKLILPIDGAVQTKEIKTLGTLAADDAILDAGPKTLSLLKEKIDKAKFVLWNGPLGLYENGYPEATLGLAQIIGEATSRGVETIVGGGDTIAAIATLGMGDKITFISTGGGAMLDFLAKGTLPGIQALTMSEME